MAGFRRYTRWPGIEDRPMGLLFKAIKKRLLVICPNKILMCSNCLKVLSFCLYRTDILNTVGVNRTDIFAKNPTKGGLSEPCIIALNSILSEFIGRTYLLNTLQ